MSVSYSNGSVPIFTDTRYILLMRILLAINAGGGGGGGTVSGQLLQYDVDPTTEGLVPTDQNITAFAYQKDGTGPSISWNTTTHVWNP